MSLVQVNHGRPVPLLDEVSLHSEALSGGFDASQSVLHGKAGVYTVTERVSSSATPTSAPGPASSAIRSNGKASDKPVNKSVSFHHEVIIRAGNAGGVHTHPERAAADTTLTHTPLLPTSTGVTETHTHTK